MATTKKKTATPKPDFTESLNDLIVAQGLSRTHIAEKIQMPWGTFKNKLNPNTPAYRFSEDEQYSIREVLKDIGFGIAEFIVSTK